MDENQVRQIIRDEMQELMASDRYIFHKTIQILDGRNIQLGRTTGTKIGLSSSEKLGFYGTTPVDKPAQLSDANVQGASYSQTDVQTIADLANYTKDILQELGLMAPD